MDQSNSSEVELTNKDLLNQFKKPFLSYFKVPPDYIKKLSYFVE